MRLENLPFILGAIVGLVAVLLLFDAWAPDDYLTSERRRRPRRERDRGGEALVGAGVLAMATAIFGRDTWRYDTIAVIAGVVLLLIGVVRNRWYLRDLFSSNDQRTGVSKPEVRELVTPSTLPDAPRRIR